MAITPRSKGLGNIGSIVNRQRLASPARPQPKPAPKLAPAPTTSRNPFAGGKTTSIAQRQAMSPFKSATKPVNKIDPLAGQLIPEPIDPGYSQNPTRDQLESMRVPPPQPFNPNPNPGQQPSFQDMFGGNTGKTFIDPNTGLPSTGPEFSNDFSRGEIINQYGLPGDPQRGGQPIDINQMFNPNSGPKYSMPNAMDYPAMQGQGGGIFGGNMGNMVTDSVGQGFGNMFGNMFGSQGQQALQTGMQGLGQMFGNPNPMASDYDQLEGSKFNTNPSNSGGFMGGGGGSMFGGGGFSGK